MFKEIKFWVAMSITPFKKKTLNQQNGLKFKEEASEVLRLEFSLYGAKTWTLRKVDQKYLKNFEKWCCRRMEISWTDRVRNCCRESRRRRTSYKP